jgi:2-polyprenyl-3-methyl-5-hydroxy-6-metoxy-1,4-benzoquinol methylase
MTIDITNSKNIISFCRNNKISFCNNLDKLCETRYDMILMTDVIEYLHHSPIKLLTSLIKMFNPNGLILIITRNCVNIKKRIKILY